MDGDYTVGGRDRVPINMIRFLSGELLLLSLGTAWLLYALGYMVSPMAELVMAPLDESSNLLKASKVMFWGSGASIIASILAAAAVIKTEFATTLSVICAAVLILVVVAAVLWIFPVFFAVI